MSILSSFQSLTTHYFFSLCIHEIKRSISTETRVQGQMGSAWNNLLALYAHWRQFRNIHTQ